MMSSEEGQLANEERLLSSEMRQTRAAFQTSSINHCLALAATLGGGAALLLAQARGQEWLLASAGDETRLEVLKSSLKSSSTCRLSVHTGSPEVWLCVSQAGSGLENVRAFCEHYPPGIFRPGPDRTPVLLAAQP